MEYLVLPFVRMFDYGRATRREFYIGLLGLLVIRTITFVVIEAAPDEIIFIVSLGFSLASIALWIRRMHDINKNGWWAIVPIVSFIFSLRKTVDKNNKYKF